MKNFLHRHKFLFILSLLFVVLFVICDVAEARAGGGGGFRGGGGGGRGGSGGGDGIGWIIYLAFRHPVIGVPLLIVFIVFSVWKHKQKQKRVAPYRVYTPKTLQKQSMTGIDNIIKRDPSFDKDKFLKRSEECFKKIQQAWSDTELMEIRKYVSDGVYERFSMLLQMHSYSGLRNHVEIESTSSNIYSVDTGEIFDEITVAVTADAVDYFIDNKRDKIVSGSKRSEKFTEYWTFLRRRDAKTGSANGLVEGFCPNCGTPLELSDSTKCSSCQAYVTSGKYDWVLSEITQTTATPTRERKVPNLAKLAKVDKGFNGQFIEDRCSTIFWALRFSQFSDDYTALKRFATKDCIAQEATRYESDTYKRFYADTAVGCVELVEVLPATDDDFNRLRIRVVWSGHLEDQDMHKMWIPDYDRSHLITSQYILKRHKDVTTQVDFTLMSSHCSGCGAPANSQADEKCQYCHASFCDGMHDWVLEKIEPFSGYPALKIKPVSKKKVINGKLNTLSMDPEQLLSILIKVMLADGVVDQRELDALNEIATQFGYPEEKLTLLIEGVKSNDFHVSISELAIYEQSQVLKTVIQVALADGVIQDDEMEIINAYANDIGYSSVEVNTMIMKAKRMMRRK